MAMNLHSRKGFVKASRFYVLVFVALTGVLGMVSPPDLGLMLVQAQTNQDRKAEADRLFKQGNELYEVKQYREAFQTWEQALTIYHEIKNLNSEGNLFNRIGFAYYHLREYQKAISSFHQALVILKQINDPKAEGASLIGLIRVYDNLNQYQKVIDYNQQALVIFKQFGAHIDEIQSLNDIGAAYYSLGQYQNAIDFFQQGSVISKQIGHRYGEENSVIKLGITYNILGQYQKAIDFFQQGLLISKQIGDQSAEGYSLNNLGRTYHSLGQHQKAIDFHQKALVIFKQIGDQYGEAASLNNLGNSYRSLGQYKKEIDFYQQSLVISKQIGDQSGEAISLGNLGNTYFSLRQYQKASNLYQQSLVISKSISDRLGESISLANLGLLFKALNQPELAILFYKQAVNVTEEIRKDIRKLDKDIQKSYLNTVEFSYRQLADLLLKQGRIMEALQVLDLLKVQELQDFFKDVKGNEKTAQGIELLNEEKEYWQSFNKQNIDLTTANTPQILQQLRQTAPAQNIKLAAYKDLQTKLQKLGSNSALLYPLILEDRLELVLFVPNAPPISRTVPVKQTELIQVAEEFRNTIQKPESLAVLDPANKLYNWMIEPIANDLKQANIQTIIYAPDGVMRHVPLAALYDGKQWLIERYRINYITALSLTNIDPQTQQTPRILAGAFTDRSGTVKIGDNNISFSSLPAALTEVENLVANFPNTTKLVNKDFNRKALESDKLNQYNIIHFATHAHLVGGSPEDSFVLLNNNEYVTLRQVKDWKLPNVGLAVFSACQTALGGKLSSGIEIIGFGYQLQQAQARASIATLWEISDGGTQALMGKFYEKMKLTSSSADALQQAQIDLIRSNGKSTDEKRAGVKITWQGIRPEVESQLNHPYYWAPFILIGNGF